MISNLLSFIYPKLCLSCERELRTDEKLICLHCEFDLYPTLFLKKEENPVFQLFWGKVNIEYASSCFNFIKGENLQEFIHEFKYKGHKNLAEFFGRKMSNYLKDSNLFDGIDAVCYVPSSKSKIKQRGYNQAEELAKVIAKQLNISLLKNIIIKQKSSKSQTDKNVFERYKNMESTFEISKKSKQIFESKHLLLVDDVVTTGATLEACACLLIKELNCKVSILTLAYRNI